MLTDQKLVANKFNNYFVNVAGKLAKDIPNHNSKYQDFLKNPNEHSIFLNETTQYEIEDIINAFGVKKSLRYIWNFNKTCQNGWSCHCKNYCCVI